MARTCSVCVHADRQAIDAAAVAGTPNRRVATQYGLTEAAVRRHRTSHLPARLAKAQEAADLAEGESLLDQLASYRRRALAILERAEQDDDPRVALLALREAVRTLEVASRIQGPLAARELPTVSVYAFDPDVVFPDPKPPSGATVLPTDPPAPPRCHSNGNGGNG